MPHNIIFHLFGFIKRCKLCDIDDVFQAITQQYIMIVDRSCAHRYAQPTGSGDDDVSCRVNGFTRRSR